RSCGTIVDHLPGRSGYARDRHHPLRMLRGDQPAESLGGNDASRNPATLHLREESSPSLAVLDGGRHGDPVRYKVRREEILAYPDPLRQQSGLLLTIATAEEPAELLLLPVAQSRPSLVQDSLPQRFTR